MKNIIITIIAAIIVIGGYFIITNEPSTPTDSQDTDQINDQDTDDSNSMINPSVSAIEHASFVMTWNGNVIYTDPVGDMSLYENEALPDLVLLTDVHPDHLSTSTLSQIVMDQTSIVAPQAVADLLPETLAAKTTVLANGETAELLGISIKAVPMYNLPEGDPDNYHVKGRGNGYVLESQDERIYIAGDTEDTPEMRVLENIDIAFVPMNLPYTMDIESAAEGVLAFAPTTVYPYHFRGTDGLADVQSFKTMVESENPNIGVVILDWYPNQ